MCLSLVTASVPPTMLVDFSAGEAGISPCRAGRSEQALKFNNNRSDVRTYFMLTSGGSSVIAPKIALAVQRLNSEQPLNGATPIGKT